MSANALIVLERAIEVHQAMDRINVRHAIGGALALGYHVADARATHDIDVNISLPKEHYERVLSALPAGVEWTEQDRVTITRDGQVRLWWPVPDDKPLPLDLFFAEHDFHSVVADRVEWAPMLDSDVPILSATDLTVFKMLFNRPKDWVDIEEMIRCEGNGLDTDEAADWVVQIVGEGDARLAKLGAVIEDVRTRPEVPTVVEMFKKR